MTTVSLTCLHLHILKKETLNGWVLMIHSRQEAHQSQSASAVGLGLGLPEFKSAFS